MNSKKTPTILALLFYSLFALAANPTLNINFIENNLIDAKKQAQAEGKLIMVDFWASWCSPCKWMDEQTFSRPEVANYLNNNYISVRINIDNFDGMTYKDEYEVRFLPTILVLDPNGKVIKKYEESMAPSKLLRILKDLEENKVLPPYINRNMVQSVNKPVTREQKEVRTAPTYHPSTTGTSKQKLAHNNRTFSNGQPNRNISSANTSIREPNQFISSPVTRSNRATENKPSQIVSSPANHNRHETAAQNFGSIYKASDPGKISNAPTSNFSSSGLDAVSDVGLYQLNVKKAPRRGFSVQVGAYYDYKNVLTEVAKFQKIFAEEVLVHISELNGTTCYKIMLGHYNSYEEATNDKKILAEAGTRDAFVKDLAALVPTINLAASNP